MTRPDTAEQAPYHLSGDEPEVKRIAQLRKKRRLELADYYAIGEQMRRLEPPRSGGPRKAYGKNWRQQAAGLVGFNVGTLNHALQFNKTCRPEEVAELEVLGVSWSRLRYALAVKSKDARHDLLRKAKEARWDQKEFQRAVQQHNGQKGEGGRPRRKARNQGVLGDAAELLDRTKRWLEFQEAVWGPAKGAYEAQLKAMPEERRKTLAKLLKEATEQLKELHNQSEAALTLAESLHAIAGSPDGTEPKAKSRHQRKRDEGGE